MWCEIGEATHSRSELEDSAGLLPVLGHALDSAD
jgi:hypothetical protein